jgi:transcriptional regulator with XRE-family HTH domain
MTEQAAFGAELRRTRERRGLTLDAIAGQTKVGAAHFAGLERGDLSRWPPGIFRRAFVRSYALAVGLDAETTLARFLELFPEGAAESRRAPALAVGQRARAIPVEPAAPEVGETDAPGLRLALEHRPAKTRTVAPVARRLAAGLLDVSVAVVPAALVALAAGIHLFWPVAACVALAGHLACYAWLGTTPGAWAMARFIAPPAVEAADRVERRRIEGESMSPRRRATRVAGARPSPHAHRVRH